MDEKTVEVAARELAAVNDKVVGWLHKLAKSADKRAEDRRFPSLADANLADARNYRATAKSVEVPLAVLRTALGDIPNQR